MKPSSTHLPPAAEEEQNRNTTTTTTTRCACKNAYTPTGYRTMKLSPKLQSSSRKC